MTVYDLKKKYDSHIVGKVVKYEDHIYVVQDDC